MFRLQVALRLGDDVPIEYQADYERWKGEPVRAIIIPKKLFRQNGKGYPVLLRHHQNIILSLAHLEPYIVIEVSSRVLELVLELVIYLNVQVEEEDHADEEFHFYAAYITKGLWTKRKDIDSIAQMTTGFEDTLQMPLQPLMDHLESCTYEVFEKG